MNHQTEQLMSRVIDQHENDQDWRQFTALADQDPELWRELAESFRDENALTDAMNCSVAVADTVEAPVDLIPRSLQSSETDDEQVPEIYVGPWKRSTQWAGWAVAALLILAFAIVRLQFPMSTEVPGILQAGTTGQVTPIPTADEALQFYLNRGQQRGTVLQEIPQHVLLSTRQLPNNEGYELLYVRQILERAVVPDLYHHQGQNDSGQPNLVRYQQPQRTQRPVY